jgi:hypothetical protein
VHTGVAPWKLTEAAVSAQTPIARLMITTMECDMAKKIVVTEYISLDGVIEDPVGMENSGLGNWTGPFSRGPEGDRFKQKELFAADALIFGRATYEAVAAAWPHIKDESGYADRINTLPKYMASSTLKSGESPEGRRRWRNSDLRQRIDRSSTGPSQPRR